MQIEPIAHYHCDFKEKFGIPRQSGIIPDIKGTIVFEPQFRDPEYLRGLDGFDYLWLIWGFSVNRHPSSGSTVRPPRLGGNRRIGVFASRSPYRPTPLGLSSVKLEFIEPTTATGNVLHVKGGDLLDNTPIYDIKPYLEFTDSHIHIKNGYVDTVEWELLEVRFSEKAYEKYSEEKRNEIARILEQDPRPHYQETPGKVYKMRFGEQEIHFTISGKECNIIE